MPPPAKVGVLAELAEMLAASVRELGTGANVVYSDPSEALECDAIVLFGDCVRLDPVVSALRSEHSRARPPVVLWQLDSLPPPSIGDEDLRKGLRAARAETNLRSRRLGVPAAIAGVIPVETRRRLKSAVLRLHSPGVRSESKVSASARAAEHRQILRRFERIQWLLRASEEGLLGRVFMSAPERVEVLDRIGVHSQLLPVGYHPMMGTDLGKPRDIDAMFLGYEPTTKVAAASIGEALSSKGVELDIPQDFLLGSERAQTLNRVKVFLNLQRHENYWELSRVRLLLGMACGAMIVSDAADDMAPFVPGEHFVVAKRQDMPEVIEHYVRNEDDRRRIAASATRLLSEHLSMSQCASTLLEAVAEPASPS